MGRGRQKAKQTKVARALKYYSPETDYARLQRELQGESGGPPGYSGAYDETENDPQQDDEDDPYGGWSSSPRR